MISAHPALQPEQIGMLQRVYDSLLREEWFDRNCENERDFARIIIGFFQRGISDEDLLFTQALSVARGRFSKLKAGSAGGVRSGCLVDPGGTIELTMKQLRQS